MNVLNVKRCTYIDFDNESKDKLINLTLVIL